MVREQHEVLIRIVKNTIVDLVISIKTLDLSGFLILNFGLKSLQPRFFSYLLLCEYLLALILYTVHIIYQSAKFHQLPRDARGITFDVFKIISHSFGDGQTCLVDTKYIMTVLLR